MSSGAPLIGVTTSEVRRDETTVPTVKAGDPQHPELALGIAYLRAVEEAGGIPVVLPPMAHELALALLDRLDGLCLSGGPDLDPSTYGAERHPDLGPVEPALDEFEITLVRSAVDRGLPVLGICRGAQTLNVAHGGTLHQHLPEVSTELEHRQPEVGTTTSHEVRTAEGSRVRRLMDEDGQVAVNSFHHQAVDVVGVGLHPTAWAPDGVVEAIESDDEDAFVLGVQWHAETLTHLPEHKQLFCALVEAAAARRASTVPA
jgi:putative glutamine amidotransferase